MQVRPDSSKRFGVICSIFCIAIVAGGCDLTKLTADSTSGLFERAAPAFEEFWDYDMAGKAAPATIIQLEGILRVVPENQKILMQLVRGYVGYTYGWIEDAAEVAEAKGDTAEYEYQMRRAKLFYHRALDLSLHMLSLNAKGLDKARRSGLEGFESWINKNFKEKEDVPVLLWTGYAWASYINASKDDMNAVADLGYATALVRRSVQLDPSYYNAAGITLLGVAATQDIAADMDTAKAYFERALNTTQRRALLIQVNMARYYAVKQGDQKLFESLLKEVMDAGDVLPEARLANRIARQKATRYQKQVKQLF